MTVETEVANLTSAVDNLATAVNVKKATLDASVSDAQSARDAAAASATSANNDKLAAQAAATSATNTAAALTGFDLEAIAASKGVTAVDVFVYDTSKDSDGGAWRKRTQHTSWYNETLNTATRGSRREFPAVAVIVAESNKVTIYDGDDPALPMWMVFNRANNSIWRYADHNATSISAVNGIVAVGKYNAANYGGVALIRFAADNIQGHSNGRGDKAQGVYKGVISERNDSLGWDTATLGLLVDARINDVAMTVLPNAPIDPATGLPVPTIAVATAGGVSVIKDDGTVVDIVHTDTADTISVWLRGDLLIYNASQYFHARPIPSADVSANARYVRNAADVWFAPRLASATYAGPSFHLHSTPCVPTEVLQVGQNVSIANSDRLNRAIVSDEYNGLDALFNYTTSTYNTGWMNGDIKGAFLSSTDTASLVGSGELVTNGDFATNDLTGWTDASTGTGTVDASSGAAVLSYVDANNRGFISQQLTHSAGSVLVVQFTVSGVGSCYVTAPGYAATYTSGTHRITVVATGANQLLQFNPTASSPGDVTVDNISVKLADADRSVNNKGLIVNGTVTRSPVATGAELVAYECSTGYLSRDFAAEFNGSDTFVWMGWHYGDPDKSGGFFSWYETVGGGSSAAYLNGYIDATTGAYRLVWQGRISLLLNATPSIAGRWAFVALVFSGNTVSYYLDGVLVSTASSVPPVDLHELRVNPSGGNKNALLRISATAPTAEQIKKIYEDEKVLFQENAAATLYGTSDAVTALAHDEDTGLLHVGTSAGRSVFQGLRRVSNTTTAVGTAISASNGLVVEE